jgi:hypothetical protein
MHRSCFANSVPDFDNPVVKLRMPEKRLSYNVELS